MIQAQAEVNRLAEQLELAEVEFREASEAVAGEIPPQPFAAVLRDLADRGPLGTGDDMAAAMEALRRLTAAIQAAQAAADVGPTQPYPLGPASTQPPAQSPGTLAHVPPAGQFA
eukprot:1352722-Lingulodinium_polyedra.AAC.1